MSNLGKDVHFWFLVPSGQRARLQLHYNHHRPSPTSHCSSLDDYPTFDAVNYLAKEPQKDNHESETQIMNTIQTGAATNKRNGVTASGCSSHHFEKRAQLSQSAFFASWNAFASAAMTSRAADMAAGRPDFVGAEAATASMRSDCFVVENIVVILLEMAGEGLLENWENWQDVGELTSDGGRPL